MKKWLLIVCRAKQKTKAQYFHNAWSKHGFVVDSAFSFMTVCCAFHQACTDPLTLAAQLWIVTTPRLNTWLPLNCHDDVNTVWELRLFLVPWTTACNCTVTISFFQHPFFKAVKIASLNDRYVIAAILWQFTDKS